MAATTNDDFFKTNVMGHPAGLFVLFFTEMWERFSYYGMRAILVIFLTKSLMEGGWGWPREHALALYGTYTSMVYLTPILGGYIADKIIGYRKAVVIGALLMTLGQACMAACIWVSNPIFMYIGLAFLIIGNGFFKPNMTSIVSHMYKNHPEKKDGAFSIFYMGVNAGAFLGMLLCGYLGEKVSFILGFGLAGVFMLLGMLQFYFAQDIFGEVGKAPIKEVATASSAKTLDQFDETGDKLNPFLSFDLVLIAITAIMALVWVVNDPLSKVSGVNLFGNPENANRAIIVALVLFISTLIIRIVRYSSVTRDKMIAVLIFAIFYMMFWMAFEQAGGSMTIFAADYTNRALEGGAATSFKIINTLLTVVPLGIITWVLYKLFVQTFGKYSVSNIILASSFVVIWGIVIWMLKQEFSNPNTEIAASWFGILNSFFIIAFSPLFSNLWESRFNPSGTVKYGVGLFLLAIGFYALSFGSNGIPAGAKTASVSIIWLIVAYFFHTLGELCISPVGLSYVSKLVPGRMIALMFGIWYLSIAVANKVAGAMGGMIDEITAKYDMSTFFMIFTVVPIIGGIIIIALTPLMKRLMHGVR